MLKKTSLGCMAIGTRTLLSFVTTSKQKFYSLPKNNFRDTKVKGNKIFQKKSIGIERYVEMKTIFKKRKLFI